MEKEKILIVGFGGHARSIADCIERMGIYEIAGYTDFNESSVNNGYKYLGTDAELENIFKSGIRKAVVGIGQIGPDVIRHNLYNTLKKIGYELPVISDPSAVISETAVIGEGSFIGKMAIVNSNAVIGKMCIINSAVLCEHDNVIGDFTHIAVRAVCCGTVTIGENCFVGANATIIQGVKIGDETTVGAGSTVLHDLACKVKKYGIV